MVLTVINDLRMSRTKWTEAMIAERIMEIHRNIGKFPTNAYLKETGQSDLANQITKKGGFLAWADRLGLQREHSDTDTGWSGEIEVMELLKKDWSNVTRSIAVKAPFDLLINNVLRVDVKSARFAKYGPCSGWFYRIGKMPQADVIALYQLDTKEVYWIPWNRVPTSNITISKSGGMYALFRNNIDIVRRMLATREAEDKWVTENILLESA
jgi:hypothetical protein